MEFDSLNRIAQGALLDLLASAIRITTLIACSLSLTGLVVYLAGIVWLWSQDARRSA